MLSSGVFEKDAGKAEDAKTLTKKELTQLLGQAPETQAEIDCFFIFFVNAGWRWWDQCWFQQVCGPKGKLACAVAPLEERTVFLPWFTPCEHLKTKQQKPYTTLLVRAMQSFFVLGVEGPRHSPTFA